MSIPSKLRELVGTAAFWSDYFGDEVFGERVAGLPDVPYLDLPISPDHSLRIGYFRRESDEEEYIQATDLRLRRNDCGKNFLLGWHDAHSHPHVLRWEEADLIGRLLARSDPELPHPGIPFLLLLPFIAPIEGSDHQLGLRLLDTALRSLGVFNENQIRYRLSKFNKVPAESEWRRTEPYGWVCHFLGKYSWEGGGRTIYSHRRVPSGSPDDWPPFPFDEWNDCMRHVERVVAEELQGRVPEPEAKPLPLLAERIELRYQVMNNEAAYATVPVLRRALFQDGLGVIYLSGWGAVDDVDNWEADPNAGDEYVIYCHGELAAVVAVISRVVVEAGRPDVRLYQLMPEGSRQPFGRLSI